MKKTYWTTTFGAILLDDDELHKLREFMGTPKYQYTLIKPIDETKPIKEILDAICPEWDRLVMLVGQDIGAVFATSKLELFKRNGECDVVLSRFKDYIATQNEYDSVMFHPYYERDDALVLDVNNLGQYPIRFPWLKFSGGHIVYTTLLDIANAKKANPAFFF